MKMKSNKVNSNVENIKNQIDNTLMLLYEKGAISFWNECSINLDERSLYQTVTWNNHVSCREVSSKAFNSLKQYLEILKNGSYQALLSDGSIIRCSYKFEGAHLISYNLLYWPCPIVSKDYSEEESEGLSFSDIIEERLSNERILDVVEMRTPIRFDFDVTNDRLDHPRAHVHMQHCDCRINTKEPMCFNSFMKFVLENFYPSMNLNFSDWTYLPISFASKKKQLCYNNTASLTFHYVSL